MTNPLPLGNNTQALAQLRDIHLPEPISWWPLAPGWYAFSCLIMFLFFMGAYFIRCYYLNGRFKRQALQLLKSYQQQYQREGCCSISAASVSELLKRVALIYFPRSDVASLRGEAWVAFLNRTGKHTDFYAVQDTLLKAPYHPMSQYDLSLLFIIAERWIKQRRGRCFN